MCCPNLSDLSDFGVKRKKKKNKEREKQKNKQRKKNEKKRTKRKERKKKINKRKKEKEIKRNKKEKFLNINGKRKLKQKKSLSDFVRICPKVVFAPLSCVHVYACMRMCKSNYRAILVGSQCYIPS